MIKEQTAQGGIESRVWTPDMPIELNSNINIDSILYLKLSALP
jgi:hypothetical protein